jgi:chromosome segregation protein
MYLKSLTILGFKSFADKTTFSFQPGITAVVGPNGCGKSNIADCIRWVLGEQSAKALRGGEMADVIFNGTDKRKPLGMSEVSLTIGDIDQDHLKAAGVELSYNEVTITRRVFRDGSSEYFINKTPCRLKDIQQLFMGTGVGRANYSLMAQGHITQILSSRPEDRRMIFEEAAGITKFKSQKKEALRKLEQTEQNLLRVSDLIREVKRQIGSLQRQAGKARRYKQILVELQHLETQLARHQFDVLQAEIGQRHTTADQLRLAIETGSEEVIRCETEISQLRVQLSDLEHQVSLCQQKSLEIKGQIDRHDGRIHFNEERLREQDSQNAKARHDIAQGEERRLAAEQELNSVNERLTASEQKLANLQRSLQTRHETLQAVESQLRSQQEALRVTQSNAFATAQQLTRSRNDINALDLQKQGNRIRIEKLSAEKIQLEEERLRLQSRLDEFAANVETEKLSIQTHRGTAEEQQQRLRQIQQEISQVTQSLDEWLRQQAGKRSRLNVLEQLQAEHEGFSAGALAALKQAPHMLGALVDKIRVPERYITAIEAALGHHLQLVLTEQPATAQEILAELRANRKGRASIAPLNLSYHREPAVTVSAPTPNLAPASDAPGILTSDTVAPVVAEPVTLAPLAAPAASPQPAASGPFSVNGFACALSVVESDESVRPLLERLLGGTFIVPDLPAATAHWPDYGGAVDFVTLSGELLSRHGVYTGGAANGSTQAPTSILGRKNQIAELQEQLAQLQEQINEQSRGKGSLQSEQTQLQAALQQTQTELRTQEVAIAARQGECKALESALRLLHQKIDTVFFEVQNLAAQEEEGRQKRQTFAAQIGELEGREKSLQQDLSDLTASQDDLRQQRDAANAQLTETKVSLATEEQLISSFRQQQQTHQQRIRELTLLVEQRQSEIAGLLERRGQFQSEIAESRQKIDGLQHEREQVNTRVAALMQQCQALETDIAGRDEALRAQRQHLTELQQQRGAIEIELAQKQMSTQNLRERIQQKYQLMLDDIRSECITITIADSGPAKVETLTPEEMAARGLATDWATVAEQVVALQQRLDEMGPVNLVAIEEYEETEQRYKFLTTQEEDLVKAKEQLLDVITRINIQTREMFAETFAKIRENFSSLFTEVFGGGQADLQLSEGNDVLESGIDIVARPPGKQLKSITLLSGGEQTMTAVALLFAIYQVKPSPFCVLDELDAPLDESNINRFIAVLKRFLVHSQFIMITHNKRTIAMANVLYGVTMQEHGVSKVVSMRFRPSEENGNAELPAATDQQHRSEAIKSVGSPESAGSLPAPAQPPAAQTDDPFELAVAK